MKAPHPQDMESLLGREVLEVNLLSVTILLDDLRRTGRAGIGLWGSILCLHITCMMSRGG